MVHGIGTCTALSYAWTKLKLDGVLERRNRSVRRKRELDVVYATNISSHDVRPVNSVVARVSMGDSGVRRGKVVPVSDDPGCRRVGRVVLEAGPRIQVLGTTVHIYLAVDADVVDVAAHVLVVSRSSKHIVYSMGNVLEHYCSLRQSLVNAHGE